MKAYSLGMRQRLGLAAALLRRPRLLILDEPTNGLDPQGIHEIRDLLIELNRAGTTVFLSSHLLSEVEQLCTRVGVVDRGRLVLEEDLDTLRGGDRPGRWCSSPDAADAVLLTANSTRARELDPTRDGRLNAAGGRGHEDRDRRAAPNATLVGKTGGFGRVDVDRRRAAHAANRSCLDGDRCRFGPESGGAA